jgi:type IV secretory pathway protease TraF
MSIFSASQPLGVFTSALIALLVFWTYGKLCFYRDPGSLLFFDASRAYERKYSDFRLKEVLGFRSDIVKKFDYGIIEENHGGTTPEVCAVFVSVDRKVDGSKVHPLEVCIPSLIHFRDP